MYTAIAVPTARRIQPIGFRGADRATSAPTEPYTAIGIASTARIVKSPPIEGEPASTSPKAATQSTPMATHSPLATRRGVDAFMAWMVASAQPLSKGGDLRKRSEQAPPCAGAGIPHMLWWRPGRTR